MLVVVDVIVVNEIIMLVLEVAVLTNCVGVSTVKVDGRPLNGEAVVKKLVEIDVVVGVEVVVGSMVVSSRTVGTGSLKWVRLLFRLNY